MTSDGNVKNLQGNHAVAVAAVAAGCRFFAGYPITPSSEIAERMSIELPKVDGVFIQMEDEMASMGAIIGASAGGAKSLTATSGPGFSLKQENIGYAALTEIPCVVVDVMRGGPSTGMPTRPSQGDIMQARWGTHGDYPVVVLTPWSVEEVYWQTIRAFNLAELLRTPVVVMFDEVIGHLVETVDLGQNTNPAIINRKWAKGDPAGFSPYVDSGNGIPEMARPGDGYRVHTTGLTHGEDGFPTQDPQVVQRIMARLLRKVEQHLEQVESVCIEQCEDADVVIVAFGIAARAAICAVKQLREEGMKVGLFRPVTLWPFAEQRFTEATAGATTILVPEMNAGQLILEIQRLAGPAKQVAGLNRFDGEPFSPQDIVERVRTLKNDD